MSREIDERTKAIDRRDAIANICCASSCELIQKELGEGDENAAEIAELEKAIADAHAGRSRKTGDARNSSAWQRMPDGLGEYSMVRTYLDWLIELPWKRRSRAARSTSPRRGASSTQDHFGLEKVKKRILEFLAVRKLNPDRQGADPVLCRPARRGQDLARPEHRPRAGPQIRAREPGRRARRGRDPRPPAHLHRRAAGQHHPGLRKAGTRNCVMMLDEIDKLGAGIHGDPSAALLEVLDPEQNNTFRDNYLDVPFDLSPVLFIATANVLDTIPGPLRDRMEIIAAARLHQRGEAADRAPLPGAAPAQGQRPHAGTVRHHRRGACGASSRDYTREAGVRSLEREIGAVCRHVAREHRRRRSRAKSRIDASDLAEILGPAQVRERSRDAHRQCRAWPPGSHGRRWAGTSSSSKRAAHAGQRQADPDRPAGRRDEGKRAGRAQLLVKSRARSLGIDAATFEKQDMHVHVPAGAMPKDGPSAGVAMFIALASLLTGKACAPTPR